MEANMHWISNHPTGEVFATLNQGILLVHVYVLCTWVLHVMN